jgi:hypothetical protein
MQALVAPEIVIVQTSEAVSSELVGRPFSPRDCVRLSGSGLVLCGLMLTHPPRKRG